MGASRIEVRGDSELIVKQITHEYKCIKGSLLKYFVTATRLLEHFEVADIRHVPKNENQEANELAQIASGYKMFKSKLQDLIYVREKWCRVHHRQNISSTRVSVVMKSSKKNVRKPVESGRHGVAVNS